MKYRIVYLVLVLLLLVGGIVGGYLYRMVYAPNFLSAQSSVRIYIDDEATFEDVCQLVSDSAGCRSLASFRVLAGWRNYPQPVKSGCYASATGRNNLEVVRMLRSGHQTTVRIVTDNDVLRFV